MKNLRYLNKFFYKYRYRFILGILFVTISNVFGILPAQVIRNAIDLIQDNLTIYYLFSGTELQHSSYSVFNWVLFFFGCTVLLLALLRGVFMFFMRQTIIVMSRMIEDDLKNETYHQFQELSLYVSQK
ncbi:MAG: ABC transporter, partial [Bacteroidetes bacterium]|nr:ABC transporter [Bacteroidota bacterium]